MACGAAAQVGAPAPPFTLRDQHGREQSLDARRGSRNVLLVFYPMAFTGVCTGEMRALSDHAARWEELRADVLAVSCDPLPSLRAFAEQEKLEVPLLSDFWPHGAVANSYGTFDDSLGVAGRATYVIDDSGTVRRIVRSAIADAREVSDYLAALAEI